jgi:hypothetical protein
MASDAFEWDDDKAEENVHDHGVTFDEAASAFGDPLAVGGPGGHRSDDGRQRHTLVGRSMFQEPLRVTYTELRPRRRRPTARPSRLDRGWAPRVADCTVPIRKVENDRVTDSAATGTLPRVADTPFLTTAEYVPMSAG